MSHHSVFPQFYDLINAFGFKISEDDRVWDGFHSGHSTSQVGGETDSRFGKTSNIFWMKLGSQLSKTPELCYCIRYVDKNGRDPAEPWSLRQVGVYQQTSSLSKRSVWILVQPPERLHKQLKLAITGTSRHEWSEQNSDMMLHLAVLSVTLSNWDQYIEYLRDKLTQLVSPTI